MLNDRCLGGEHRFIEKVPVVTNEHLTESSSYPRRGVIACGIVQRFLDHDGREIVTIDTMTPWGIESSGGHTQFDVPASMLIDIGQTPSNNSLDASGTSGLCK